MTRSRWSAGKRSYPKPEVLSEQLFVTAAHRHREDPGTCWQLDLIDDHVSVRACEQMESGPDLDHRLPILIEDAQDVLEIALTACPLSYYLKADRLRSGPIGSVIGRHPIEDTENVDRTVGELLYSLTDGEDHGYRS